MPLHQLLDRLAVKYLAGRLPQPDSDGRWPLGQNFTIHVCEEDDTPVALIRAKWGTVTSIPVDQLHHLGATMLAVEQEAMRIMKK